MSRSPRDCKVDKLTTEWLIEEEKLKSLVQLKADYELIKTAKNRVSRKKKNLLTFLRKAYEITKFKAP